MKIRLNTRYCPAGLQTSKTVGSAPKSEVLRMGRASARPRIVFLTSERCVGLEFTVE